MGKDWKPEPGWGTLFKNDYKKEGDNQPDYRGKVMVDGEMKDVALWVKKKGEKTMFSINIKKDNYVPKEEPKLEPPPF